MSDVSLAIDSGYPAEQRHKLLLRRADCYIELQSKEARTALNSAIQYAGTLNMTVANKCKYDKKNYLIAFISHIKLSYTKLMSVTSSFYYTMYLNFQTLTLYVYIS